jgi:hypothetical protein
MQDKGSGQVLRIFGEVSVFWHESNKSELCSRVSLILDMLAAIRLRIFYRPVSYLKTRRFKLVSACLV